MSDFEQAAILGGCLAKPYAREIFRLLATYRSLSASEAASRLNLHIQTTQGFLETLATLGIVAKHEANDKTRPYFRYVLKVDRISLELDFAGMAQARTGRAALARRVRERRAAGSRFVAARGRNAVSTVVIWTGSGRDRTERRINLTRAQGAALFHLPFPSDDPRPIAGLIEDGNVDEAHIGEVTDIIDRLAEFGVIEVFE